MLCWLDNLLQLNNPPQEPAFFLELSTAAVRGSLGAPVGGGTGGVPYECGGDFAMRGVRRPPAFKSGVNQPLQQCCVAVCGCVASGRPLPESAQLAAQGALFLPPPPGVRATCRARGVIFTPPPHIGVFPRKRGAPLLQRLASICSYPGGCFALSNLLVSPALPPRRL